MKTLPDKLSDLIEVALGDLAQVEKDPRYRVEMGAWHHFSDNKCEVCLAGAVMAKTLGASFGEEYTPVCYMDESRNLQYKLVALDNVRSGSLESALFNVYGQMDITDQIDWIISLNETHWLYDYDYEDDPVHFKYCLKRIAEELKKLGL